MNYAFGRKDMKQLRVWMVACVLSAGANIVQAKMVEEVIKVPVKVANGYGKEIAHEIIVTVLHDDAAPKPYPLAVIGHGRDGNAQGRANMRRATSPVNSRWLAQLGFMVAVPTRVGYGETGGEDVEDTGDCNRKNYPPGYAAAAEQTLRVLEALRARPDAARDKAVVMGVSFGGATAIAVAAMNPPGVQAALNFAGGGGGDPVGSPQNPCSTAGIKRMFATYGKTARIPTLWVYAENDMYFGAKLPKEWFDAFKAEGGTGEFVVFPPHGKDGHGLFSAGPQVWRPAVLDFLRANGYPDLKVQEVTK